MATATPPAELTEVEAEHSPEELLTIEDRLMPELIDGRLVEREPKGLRVARIAGNLFLLIGTFVKEHRLGHMHGAKGSYQIFPKHPKTVRIPDISYRSYAKIPPEGEEEGHGRIAPDLVVEVVSRNDRAEYLFVKVEDFLGAGVPLVWVVSPKARHVHVYRGDGTISLVRDGGTLDGGAVLPGFSYPVAEIFRE